jgi:hypothetical protein
MMGVMTNDGSKKGSEPEPYMVLAWFQAWHHSRDIVESRDRFLVKIII